MGKALEGVAAKESLPLQGKVDLTKNDCIVSSKTYEVVPLPHLSSWRELNSGIDYSGKQMFAELSRA